MTASIASIEHDIENPAVNEGRATCSPSLEIHLHGLKERNNKVLIILRF